MSNSSDTLNPMPELSSSESEELLESALGAAVQEKPVTNYGRADTCERYDNKPTKNSHVNWLSILLGIVFVILIALALYYLNTDTKTEERQTGYRILTFAIVVLGLILLVKSKY